MENVLYEAIPSYVINPFFVLFCVVVIIFFILLIAFWKKIDVWTRCFYLAILLFLVFIIGCQIYTEFDSKKSVYNEYIKGNYSTVEGTIENYVLAEADQPNQPDRFIVNDVDFSVPGFVSRWGYPLKNADGGVLKDGMSVRIYYIHYKFENVIMKLEILPEGD